VRRCVAGPADAFAEEARRGVIVWQRCAPQLSASTARDGRRTIVWRTGGLGTEIVHGARAVAPGAVIV
jgi:hypothetical protein